MIFVDTSVWVAFFRGSEPTIVIELGRLLDEDRVALSAVVRVELLTGIRAQQRRRVAGLLDAVPTWRPASSTWDRVEEMAVHGASQGERFGVGDLLIAATAAEQGGAVWSLDGDFRRMAALGLVTCWNPA